MSFTKPARLAVLSAGAKGLEYVEGLLRDRILPELIISYPQEKDASNAFERLKTLARTEGISFQNDRRPVLSPDLLHIAVGWQYLVKEGSEHLVVFHDSLLPKYRGFAPTVSALINGEKNIGVSALRPVEEVDAGPVYASMSRDVSYPLKIADALVMQVEMMLDLTAQLLEQHKASELNAFEQDHDRASYSIWRDRFDYWIDWSSSAERVVRTIDALGYPYEGACSCFDGEKLILKEAVVVKDINFEIRQPGKIWSLCEDGPIVVCGKGCIQITRATLDDGSPYEFRKLRGRFDSTV